MKYELVALSPIHIGNGSQINNWSYAVENGKIKIYNFDKVVKELKTNPQRLINLTADIERHPLDKTLGDFLKNFKLNINPTYTLDFKGKMKKSNSRKNIEEYKQIWEFIKENGNVYIPGTEIKGAIRTALFYKILRDKLNEDSRLKEKFLKEYEECINRGEKIKRNFSDFEKKWESIVFRAGFEKAFDKKFKYADAKKDILKILLISDSDQKNPEEVLQVKDISAIKVSRHFDEPHELVKTGSKFTIDIKIPFKDEYKKIFPNTYVYLGLKKLREACADFSLALLDADIEYFRNTKELDFDIKSKIIEKLEGRKKLANIAKTTNEKKMKYIILRIGKHQGFLSTTINLLVKELNPDLYARAYEYLVPKGYSDFPNKSRKLTIDNELLGWCVLIPQE